MTLTHVWVVIDNRLEPDRLVSDIAYTDPAEAEREAECHRIGRDCNDFPLSITTRRLDIK